MKYLYHGSKVKGLKLLTPSSFKSRNGEGTEKVVFATTCKAFASCFIVPADDSFSWLTAYWYKNKYQYLILIGDEKRYRKLDRGGSIYTVSSDNFKGNIHELICKSEVKVIKEKNYDSGINAMIKNQIPVYFLEETLINELKERKKDVTFVFEKLRNCISENEERGYINPIKDE